MDTQATERCLQVADRVPHEGYLRRSREHVGHLCGQNGDLAEATGLLRAEADHRHPRTPQDLWEDGCSPRVGPTAGDDVEQGVALCQEHAVRV